jgi:hypothetical protein
VRTALVILLLSLAASCAAAPEPAPDPDLRILFIGNSLTLANDLPGLVAGLGRSDPSRRVVVASVASGGYSLEDHWNRGDARRAIGAARWDLVVLQQGPSALPESRALLIEYVRRFSGDIRAVGGRPAIYMVWPPLDREADWDAVTASHAAAADAVNGLLLPAGEALRAARRTNPDLPLFEGDGFHPNLAGSYGAALAIYARAAQVSPIGLTLAAGAVALSPAAVTALEAAAADALARFPSR